MTNLRFPLQVLVALITVGFFMHVMISEPFATVDQAQEEDSRSCPICPEIKFPESPKGVVVPMKEIASGEPIILPQDDQNLIDYIWSNEYIQPPSKKAYNLVDPNTDPSRGQGQFIQKFLKNQKNGFFVECGALDGETRSNTLFMEMHLNWKGLLIEGDPKNFALLQKKNRKAWAASNCLSVKPHPHKASFLQRFNTGQVLSTKEKAAFSKDAYVEVQCMPLFSLLAAINVTTVDYFSLDVEGNELQVLKTIPFERIFIRTLSVEYTHTTEGKDKLIRFMKSKGYKVVGEVYYSRYQANDVMFAHKDVKLPTN